MLNISCVIIVVTIITRVCTGLRLCAPGEDKKAPCNDLRRDLSRGNLQISCIHARDRYECLEFLLKDYVDTMLADPFDAYVSQQQFGSKLLVIGQTVDKERSGETFRYEAVAVVRKSTVKSMSDLKGARSCHTGYGKTSGWKIPLSQMIKMNVLPKPCDEKLGLSVVEQNLKAVSAFFGQSCIPGQWAPDQQTNDKLKLKYSQLCSLCSNPAVCDGQDQRSGYEGALRCLTEAQADVAWTKLSTAQEFFSNNMNASNEYGFLCKDGTVRPYDQPCHWAGRPWNIWLVLNQKSHQKDIGGMLRSVIQDSYKKSYANRLFGAKKESTFKELPTKYTTKQYIRDHMDYISMASTSICPQKPVRLCIDSKPANRKCNAMSIIFKSRLLRPHLKCVLNERENGCLELVSQGNADIYMASGSSFYKGFRDYNLVPILSERYGLLNFSYYGVALIKANSSIRSIEDLKGKASCHTAVDRTAGWKLPVSILQKKRLLGSSCDIPKVLANYFSVSCIPGIKDKNYDPDGTNPESLCGLCPRQTVSVQSESASVSYAFDNVAYSDRCSKSVEEPYYGYTGAFRCLVERGDVAFVKHTTVGDNTNGNSKELWSENLHSKDFRLLCPEGGTADAISFENCNWGQVPSRKLLCRSDLSESRKEDIRILFSSIVDKFPRKQDVISLFGVFQGRNNLIFGDDTTSFDLVKGSPMGAIDMKFFDQLDNVMTCHTNGSPIIKISVSLLLSTLILLL